MAQYKEIQILNFLIFFEIHLEKRNSSSFSIRQDKVIVRLPRFLTSKKIAYFLKKAEDWTQSQLENNPKLKKSLPIHSFPNSFSLRFCENIHSFHLNYHSNSSKISISGFEHELPIDKLESKWMTFQQTSKMISDVAKHIYRSKLQNELLSLQNTYTEKTIGQLRLKYNKSNWGSCSSKNNINLNTRLVLLPQEVRSYIMLHELAHLYYMNHSDKFWNLVQSWQPNYQEHIAYLNNHHHTLDFYPQIGIVQSTLL